MAPPPPRQPRQLNLVLTLFLLCFNVLFGQAAAAQEDEAILNSEIARLNNQSLLWGPYRPNLYFGVRPRMPKALMTGLMWGKVETYTDYQTSLRYTCEQNEGMKGYGWDEYDTRRGGVQSIHDTENGIDITTSFVKVPGGATGGSWAARVKGRLQEGVPSDRKTAVILYVTQEGLGTLEAAKGDDENGYEGDVTLNGNSAALGDYKLVLTKGKGKHPKSDHKVTEVRGDAHTVVQSLTYQEEFLWQAKGIVFKQLKESVDAFVDKYFDKEDPPPAWQVFQLENRPGAGNVHIIQRVFEGDFEFDILFSSASAGKELSSADLTREIQEATESFGERFSSVFAIKAPFTAEKYEKFGRSMFSNLIGGIGYFFGESVVDRSYAPEYEEDHEGFWEEAAAARARNKPTLEGPYELFTSVPSRPFFPRGFLWDEGFHLIPIADWDIDLAMEIVKSWYNLMDEDGWIAREQILGAEARSKVPEEFQTQYPHYANPPTLFFIVDTFVNRLRNANGTMPAVKEHLSQGVSLSSASIDNVEVGLEYLRRLYPLLRRQFYWFKKTQYGDIKSYDRDAYSSREAYRWRGRTLTHCLTSGLDDYPRPQPPHPGELHVDLMSWVGLMAKSLANAAEVIAPEEVEDYTKVLDGIEHNLDDLHWSEKDGCYCDATIDEFEEHQLVCHKGYISLSPFLTGLLKPDSPKLGKILALIGDEEELWSPYGIRSLSKKDENYGTAENYWRSPIWININYLIITQLHNLATQEGPYQETARDMYQRLRKNVVETIYNSWEETGFAWEQYNPETGKGQRTQHFTGWTSLVVKILAMEDLPEAAPVAPVESQYVKDEL
ncbi:glycoside hydrolase [Neurospora crassa]|uniref:Mannosyl-oligosaccharide glucosidase n=2 Tax=Neurospora crassa TaxID=5141 RepID=V5INU3_NEUCR|nr:mannosyl-oligosaccharide glucosidase, variant [Neurospora crassa OR74A]ESA42431.1 mannosyl-oligosaccharide glucosidase, variant [Neurospora crassa OR74A]KHE88870.1 glycoside hydrolase [Neurospora crassa]CAC18158.1 related to ER glucosidase I [Neurospora crassa]|eukprot:XP_011394559.1 mannosyl-oligosaccharide glucosidase, variant [Neurospora crassa OR74A]